MSHPSAVVSAITGSNRHIPELDGLRAVAIAIVLIGHFGVFGSGADGVTLFFYISGFIITKSLMNAMTDHGELSVAEFYLRRLFRLMPALSLMIAVSLFVVYAIQGKILAEDAAFSLFYLANYAEIYGWGLSRPTPAVNNPFSALWSLAVEEHYYLVFPWIMLCLGRRGGVLLRSLCALVVVVLLWRIWIATSGWTMPDPGGAAATQANGYRIYKGTDTRLDGILFGAILAVLVHLPPGRVTRVVLHPWAFSAALLALVLEFAWLRRIPGEEIVRYTIQGACLAPILAQLVMARQPDMAAWLLRHPGVVWVGQLSYSIYLFHWPAMTLASYMAPYRFSTTWHIWAVTGTATLSLLSYYCVERPVLRWYRQRAQRCARIEAAPSAATKLSA